MNKLQQRLEALEHKHLDSGVYIVVDPELWVLGAGEETPRNRNGTQEDAARLAEQHPHATVVHVVAEVMNKEDMSVF